MNWPVIATVISAAAGIVGVLILLNLKTLKTCIVNVTRRLDKQEERIEKLVERKNLCNQDYVGKVEYIRSTNSLEESMKDLTKSVATLAGTMKVIEQMPAICGNIAREITKEIKAHG